MEKRIIRKSEIDVALDKDYRQYLCGHLTRPQPFLEHFDDDIEVGISYYKEFTADAPHMHPVCTEHAYVLSGATRILLLGQEKEELEINEGDYFVLPPNTPYASKHLAGTKLFFIKSPGTNDKTLVSVDVETKEWLKSW